MILGCKCGMSGVDTDYGCKRGMAVVYGREKWYCEYCGSKLKQIPEEKAKMIKSK